MIGRITSRIVNQHGEDEFRVARAKLALAEDLLWIYRDALETWAAYAKLKKNSHRRRQLFEDAEAKTEIALS